MRRRGVGAEGWVFILLLHAATFGGDFQVQFHTQTEEGCWKLQKVVMRQIEKEMPYLKVEGRECRRQG